MISFMFYNIIWYNIKILNHAIMYRYGKDISIWREIQGLNPTTSITNREQA